MGYAAWPNRTGAAKIDGRFIRFGKKGSGDIIMLLPTPINGRILGVHCEIECKTGNATQSKGQKTHMRIVRNNGGVYLVVRSRSDLKAEMQRLGYGHRAHGGV